MKGLVEILPRYITAIYNRCLREGIFPKRWKKALIIPIIEPGKEEKDEMSKFRPKSLLDIGRKLLEKTLINRINHHVYSRGHMNENQFGFIQQESTIDAAKAIKDFVEEGLAAGEVIALVSLDVQGVFDAAWWPGIQKELWECGCPKNIYGLTKGYFIHRTASLSTNNLRTEKEISRGCPKGLCCGPGFWNLQLAVGTKIYGSNKSGGLRRRPNYGDERRVGKSSGKLREHRAKQNKRVVKEQEDKI